MRGWREAECWSREAPAGLFQQSASVPRALLLVSLLALASCGDEAWPCEDGAGALYDVRTVRFPTDFEADLVAVESAEICLLEPSCPCRPVGADGRLSVRLPRERRLLIEVRAPSYLTTVTTHVTGVVDRFAQFVLLERNTATLLAASVGRRLDASRGHVGIRVTPSVGADVSGTTYVLRNLDTDETFPLLYVVDGTPSVDATASDATGAAVAVNVPPGNYRVESPSFASCAVIDSGWPIEEDGRLIGLEFPIHADSISVLDVLECLGPPDGA